MLKVKKNSLLMIACLVWGIAGINILRIGLLAYPAYVTVGNIILSVAVFSVFQYFIFGKLVKRHTQRIRTYEEEKQFFLKFFDVKSFVIMAVMMTGGIYIRESGLGPEIFIAVFYSGLGASLLLAGILFGRNYFREISLQKKTAQRCCQIIEKETNIMQAFGETLFDVVYLVLVITVGIKMIRQSKGDRQYRLFGIMAVTLGCGDAFHLVPRAYALCTTGLENYTAALGIGKFITSITMTVFYILLYYVWRTRYKIEGKKEITIAVYLMAALRIILCLFPQNAWTSADAPLSWGIYRNIPFAILGLIVIVLFYRSAKEHKDRDFRWMWLTIVLSFGFYIPVVLWADTVPAVGMLMIPKTCAYVWTVMIGYQAMRKTAR